MRWDTIGRGGARGRAVRKTDEAHSRSGACTKRRARPIDSSVQYTMTKRAGPERRKLLIAGSGSLAACISYLLPHPSHLWLSYLLFCAVPARAVALFMFCSDPVRVRVRVRVCVVPSKSLPFAALFLTFFSIFDRLFYASHFPPGSGRLPPHHLPPSEAAGIVPRRRHRPLASVRYIPYHHSRHALLIALDFDFFFIRTTHRSRPPDPRHLLCFIGLDADSIAE